MLAAAPSAAVLGIDALDVLVEVHVANGLPQWTVVGMKPPSLGVHDAQRPVMRRAYRAGRHPSLRPLTNVCRDVAW